MELPFRLSALEFPCLISFQWQQVGTHEHVKRLYILSVEILLGDHSFSYGYEQTL